MATLVYQECYARAQELRERIDRMQRWLADNATTARPEELSWRRKRFESARREYAELLQIIRAYRRSPSGAAGHPAGGAEGLTDPDAAPD